MATDQVLETLVKEHDEGAVGKLARKSKEFPFMPIGLSGALMGVLYGAYKFRSRGEMSTSIFLIHLRVAAQGSIVAALSLGVCYSLYQDFFHPKPYVQPVEHHSDYKPKPHPLPEVRHPHYK